MRTKPSRPSVRGVGRRLGRASLLFAMALLGYCVCIWAGSIFTFRSPSSGDLWDLAGRWALAPVHFAVESFGEDGRIAAPILVLIAIHAIATAFLGAPAILRPVTPAARVRSLRLSLAGAALVASTLTLGALGLVLDILALVGGADSPLIDGQTYRGLPCLIAWAACGAFWSWLLARAGTARSPSGIDRTVRWLFAGSAVEAALAVPTIMALSRRSACSCKWNSWWVLTVGLALILMMCGPAVVLLLSRRTRRGWVRDACVGCGYPRHGLGAVCPECGRPSADPEVA